MLWRSQGGMLLDCGEGTYGQLRRRYGAATDEIVAGLKCVWISHIHADHHAGLGRSGTFHAATLAALWQLASFSDCQCCVPST